MKKTVSLISIIMMMVLSTTSCKNVKAELSWLKLEGTGSYDSQTDTSLLKLEGRLRIEQPNIINFPLQLFAADWVIFVLEGDRVIFEIHQEAVHSVLGDVFLNTSELGFDMLWVYIETTTPIAGDIFNGANPDTIFMRVAVKDIEGNSYEEMNNSGTFAFNRN